MTDRLKCVILPLGWKSHDKGVVNELKVLLLRSIARPDRKGKQGPFYMPWVEARQCRDATCDEFNLVCDG